MERLGGEVKQGGKIIILVGKKVTDADLMKLASVENLTDLYLSYTQVTDVGIQQLQAAMPSLVEIRR